MNFAFFAALTPDEADQFLRLYVDVESPAADRLIQRAAADGVTADFTVGSVPGVMRWAAAAMTTVPVEAGPDIPAWIRDTPAFARDLFDFDEPSTADVLAVSYYFGESFVRSSSGRLRWSTGNREFAAANQPVVAGFPDPRRELPPVQITEALFSRVVKYPEKLSEIDVAVERWQRSAALP